MKFFALEGTFPSVLTEGGKAFIWNASDEAWGEISARALMAEPRTVELTKSEFETDLAVRGIDPNTLSAIETKGNEES